MELTLDGINRIELAKKGYILPEFDREAVGRKTYESPFWIHFGAGNIFRAFQANAVMKMLNKGKLDRGLIVAEGYDYEIITKMNKPHDDLTVLATLKADGNIEKTIVGSVTESYALDSNDTESFDRLKEIFSNESLQMASFTITEKGYSLVDANGDYLQDVARDFANGPEKAVSYMGKVTSLLYQRYLSGELPIAMVSMDNCSHNGDKLLNAVDTFAVKWAEAGCSDAGFKEYVENKSKVSFPWTMIDKITPRPDDSVRMMIEDDGFSDMEAIVTGKNTYIAPFVNSEECEYLVIEDDFPNGRERLEEAGFYFTDRTTVDKVERMKVCTCLNPLHTALAVYGCLLGYTKIADEMKDAELKKMVEIIGYKEGLPVVVNPGIIDPKEFIDTVIGIRVPNPFMPDTPQRIATDTSQKIPIRYGETIKNYCRLDTLNVDDLEIIPLVFAGWIRYLMGVDDSLEKFEISSDPMLDYLLPIAGKLEIGQKQDYSTILDELMKNEKIFGTDLTKIGMDKKVYQYLEKLTEGKGAVRKTLKEYCR